MTSTTQSIVENILAVLKDAGLFAAVTAGPDDAHVGLPRASLCLRGHGSRPADDGRTHWHRLRVQLLIRTAGATAKEALDRAMELHQQVRTALEADVFRGGLACHLPWGRATQIGSAEPAGTIKPPGCGLQCEVTCHYETPEAV